MRKIDASRIEEAGSVGVVFFKTSLSTGWDCPRAEVMMSFRRAQDHTYIAQLLGRMVRSPLARRIERDAALNDVHLFLPHFNEQAVTAVVEDLKNVEDVPPSETGSSRELVTLTRRSGSDGVFEALSQLVTYRVNAARQQRNLRRLMGLARALTIDKIDEDAWKKATANVLKWLDSHIAQLKASGQFESRAESVLGIAVRTTTLNQEPSATSPDLTYRIDASGVDIDARFDQAGRLLGNGLHMEYWGAHRERDANEAKVEIILMTQDPDVMADLERKAEIEFDLLFDKHRRAIGKVREQRRLHYEKLRLATAKPKDISWVLPDSIDFRRDQHDPEFDKHLYVEADGKFRANLGPWERDVIQEELKDKTLIAWLRNLDRKSWSFEIPYDTGGEIRPMFPDFIVVRRVKGEYLIDILEPHDPSLSDNFEKAIGLARFAEDHGHLFDRVFLIRKQRSPSGGSRFFRLGLNKESVRKEILMFTSNSQLDALFDREAL